MKQFVAGAFSWRRLLTTALVMTCLVGVPAPRGAAAKTPDGVPPSREQVCDGLHDAAFGLCNAYCEAQDCDVHDRPSCHVLRRLFQRETGTSTFPCDATPTPAPTNTSPPTPTPTNTAPPTATRTLRPTATNTAPPTATNTAPPTATNTVPPTATPTPTSAFPCDAIDTPPPVDGDLPGAPIEFQPSECFDAEGGMVGTHPGAVLVMPKIIADELHDTLIEITNTSNILTSVFCTYVKATAQDPTQPPGPGNPPQWLLTDFVLKITRQQPVQWLLSQGRPAGPDPTDPGSVPPVPLFEPFVGELKCVVVDDAQIPLAHNAVTGVVTLLGPDADVSKYDAITIPVLNVDNPIIDNVIRLDNINYAACPGELQFNMLPDGGEDVVFGAGSQVRSRLTLVPCTENFELQQPSKIGVTALLSDEFELRLSASFQVDCWLDADAMDLSPVFAPFGDSFRLVRIRPIAGNFCSGGPANGQPCLDDAGCGGNPCRPSGGVLGVVETTHTNANGQSARDARNLQTCGSAPPSFLTLPQPPPGP